MTRDRDGFTLKPLTPSRWSDLERLFGDRGACGGCWCMYWRLTRPEFERGKGAGNRRAFKTLVAKGTARGVIAYHDREPVAWCAAGPREDFPRLARSRVLSPIDDQPVWSVTCFFVLRPYRRRGLTVRLLAAAAEMAGRAGARLVEGYPVESRGARMPDVFAWTGLSGAFRRAGFEECARRSPTRPIMRRAATGPQATARALRIRT
ncbi:MAG TPA: GNAT family N-acetyltransferase [Candidatus Cryosericum sp.]|nr:GNAT family N-acetyltransferase [Candidatus Cryosericum sp.]